MIDGDEQSTLPAQRRSRKNQREGAWDEPESSLPWEGASRHIFIEG